MPLLTRFHLVAVILICATTSLSARDLQILPRSGTDGFELNTDALSVTSTATGDFDNDGIDDFALGLFLAEVSGDFRAAVQIVYGSGPATLPPQVSVPSSDVRSRTFYSTGGSGALYYTVASAGDVNNDGFDDLLIDDNPNRKNRSAEVSKNTTYLLYGANDYLVNDLEVLKYFGKVDVFIEPAGRPAFQKTISGAGDMNGDGFDDIVISYPDGIAGDPGTGSYYGGYGAITFILFGRAYPFGYAFKLDVRTLDGFDGRYIEGRGGLGVSLAAIGDWNDDGFDDLAIGRPHFGRVWIIFGRSELKKSFRGESAGIQPGSYIFSYEHGPGMFFISSREHNDEFGFSLGGAGDVNGDGFPDLLLGSKKSGWVLFGYDTKDLSGCRRVYPEEFSIDDLPSIQELSEGGCGYRIVAPESNPETYVIAASDSGDLNSDGLTDIAVRFRTPGFEEDKTIGAVIFGEPVTGRYIEVTPSYPVFTDSMIGYTGRLLTVPYSFNYDFGGYTLGWTGDFNSDLGDTLTIGLPILAPGPEEASVVFE